MLTSQQPSEPHEVSLTGALPAPHPPSPWVTVALVAVSWLPQPALSGCHCATSSLSEPYVEYLVPFYGAP